MLTRRQMLAGTGAAALLPGRASAQAAVAADWQAFVAAYRVPDWFRDAKFGIWAHWGPQCVPERGDWYGRQMYIQGNPYYEHHVRTYGHPSRVGFMELIGRWRAENWEPEALIARFRRAGARYFMAMANHHDNFDNFDSAHHAWNSVRVGPRRDIVGTWARLAREAGLRFGVSNHSGHAWHWWQTAYGYDAEGPMRGRRYDAWALRREDGVGTWWDGLDPQALYTGPSMAPPEGITSAEALRAWHDAHSGQWVEHAPPGNPAYVRHWLARQMDLVDRYRPDMVYLDHYRLPFGQAGLEAVAHYYNRSHDWHGDIDVVLTANRLSSYQRYGIVENVERGFLEEVRQPPWQTATCLGNWHYDRPLYERRGYRSAKNVIQRLCDAVSKNGNLLLSVPMRGDGSIDDDEVAILDDLTRWFAANGEAIYETRPWRVFGEGPTRTPEGHQGEGQAGAFNGRDIRFTTRGDALHAFFLEWPEGEAVVETLGRERLPEAVVERVELLGGGPLEFTRDETGLRLKLPRPDDGAFVPGVRILGRGLV
ncbi:alpha-L-fucosidase [Sphingosinicella terrae]|uniref:alpha-L-fucosidase n=1 Tax=Sphingosinicella terrae TaxID=2172047 RepID=UPI000E0D31C1|nr:alpha-L-fucosidase [Sphingosinicella terrae]